MLWTVHLNGRIVHQQDCLGNRIGGRGIDAKSLDQVVGRTAVTGVADKMAVCTGRVCLVRGRAIKAENRFGCFRIYKLPAANKASRFVVHTAQSSPERL